MMHPSTASAAPAVLPLARCPSVRPSDWPRHVGARHNSAAKIGLLEGFHVLVLLCVFPCTVFWWPVYRSNVYGNLVLLRSEEHTSELQSLRHLVCRLLLAKKIYTPQRLGMDLDAAAYALVSTTIDLC